MGETREEKIERLQKEGMAAAYYQRSFFGKVIALVILGIGIGSFFLYRYVFNIKLFLSIILAIATWIFFSFYIDKKIVNFITKRAKFD